MCTSIFICHGDKTVKTNATYTKEQVKKISKDCAPAMYYITNDGKYAIDADFVDINDLDNLDLNSVPKIKLK